MASPFATATKITTDIQRVERCQRIAAIDFGTTFCSLAYALSEKGQVANVGLNWVLDRVPTAILLEKITASNSLNVANFGFQAQEEIIKLGKELEEYVYFECFKMKLSREVVSLK